jgi:dienelactone hydrolase
MKTYWVLAAMMLVLPGTKPLTRTGDIASQMLDGIDGYLLQQLAESPGRRGARWGQDAGRRERFRQISGLVDERVPFESPAILGLVAEAPGYKIHAVRWPVLRGVDAEGLLLEPDRPPVARVVALPDADWTPEMIAGLAPGVTPAAQFARRLAESGCLVLVPALIDRGATVSVPPNPLNRVTNQTRREFVYRMAFQMGRHVAGYEVQKVLAAVDWFTRSAPARPVGVAGYGEGGLVVLYSAAADTRIDAALVSGYFQQREGMWEEPVYRNVWGLLTEFGDAEIAGLIAPRGLVIEASRGPEVPGPPPVIGKQENDAAPGRIASPLLASTKAEYERARRIFGGLGAANKISLAGDRNGAPGSEPALSGFVSLLGARLGRSGAVPTDRRAKFDPAARQREQFEQLVGFTQGLVQRSEFARKEFWSKADVSSVEAWNRTKDPYRRYLWEEVLGKLPPPSEPLAVETRLAYDRPNWKGYEVLLPLYPEVFAYGILLVPKDLKPGERRPVVVCTHGRGRTPQILVEPDSERVARTYKRFAAQLADRGFIVYAPQQPYIYEERYRYIQRKANPLKVSLFSFILSQHERMLDWLAGLPYVDADRIGFYGLSYGGKTAVRVPPLLDRYALSICSGDWNEYTGKMAGIERADSFMFTYEHEMYEFNLGSTFDYSDMAALMAPKPFMVERGHRDGVGMDEWVAYEYAKLRRFYTFLGIRDRTEIEFFNGVHEINAEGTFRFLHKHLKWPER